MEKEKISKVPVEDASFCIVDVETTGLSPQRNGIIEIGLVKVSNLKVIDTYHSLINPGKDIPFFITQLTGISNEDVYNAPFFEDVADDIAEFIGDDILTAHNFPFDNSFLRKEFRYCGKEPINNLNLCTLKLSRRLYPMLRSKSLGAVCNHLRLKNTGEHRALGDAEVTAKVLIKIIKDLKKNHKINYVNELINFQAVPQSYMRQAKVKKQLGQDVSVLPDSPGIYYFLNSRDEIIYIGKAKSLKSRVKSYFLPTAPRKAKKIIKQASRLKIEITNSELIALLMEAELIKIINPRHNVMLKGYGNKYFLRITATHQFPALEICNYFDFDGNDYFGLFISRKKADLVHEMITKTFALRECTDKEFSKGKACFLAEIERCTVPCVNKGKPEYFDELEKIYDFLYGKNQFALNRLINKMKEHSDKQKYEKAAEVKQLIDMILSQTHKSSLLAEPVNLANVLFEINEGFGKDYVLMIAGKIFIKKYAISNKDYFDEALDDYFENTIHQNSLPNDEDLEKMKITLNWLIKNRNKVKTFYLKEYKTKAELFAKASSFGLFSSPPKASTFDIKRFLPEYSLAEEETEI
jgi:DNA polymerase-3 subunit epsilon